MWRNTVRKYSLRETEKLVRKYRDEFNSIVSEKLEITQEKAIEITDRFNSVEGEIEYFNQRMREAKALLMKLDNTNELIQNTVEKNLSRDEALITMNKELEDLKRKISGSDGGLSNVMAEMVNGMEEALKRIKAVETNNAKLKKDFDDFEHIIVSIVERLKVLEK